MRKSMATEGVSGGQQGGTIWKEDGIETTTLKEKLTCAERAIAFTISVLLSITITAPVPRPDCASFSEL